MSGMRGRAVRKTKTWRVIATIRRTIDIEADNASTAEKIALNNVLMAAPDDVVTVRTGWMDSHGVMHIESCKGNHCGHRDCTNDYYCHKCSSNKND